MTSIEGLLYGIAAGALGMVGITAIMSGVNRLAGYHGDMEETLDDILDEHEAETMPAGKGAQLRWLSNQELVNHVLVRYGSDSLEHELALRLDTVLRRVREMGERSDD